MKLAEMIGYIQRGVYSVAFALNATGTRVDWVVTCEEQITEERRHEMNEMAAQDDEMVELFHMTMTSDVRLCPAPDDHRATYVYNRKHACFCCETCVVARHEKLTRAKEDITALGFTIPSETRLF